MALPKNTLFIRVGCGAERLQQPVDTSQHVGRGFYLIKYTQNGSCPRGGRRIEDFVQTLRRKKNKNKTLSYIKLEGGAQKRFPEENGAGRRTVVGVHRKYTGAFKTPSLFIFFLLEHLTELAVCSVWP